MHLTATFDRTIALPQSFSLHPRVAEWQFETDGAGWVSRFVAGHYRDREGNPVRFGLEVDGTRVQIAFGELPSNISMTLSLAVVSAVAELSGATSLVWEPTGTTHDARGFVR